MVSGSLGERTYLAVPVRYLGTTPAPLPPLWFLSFPPCSCLLPFPPPPAYSDGINVNFLLALLTQHSVKYSFPMHVFHPDWNLLDAKHKSFLLFGFFLFALFLSGTIRRYSCLFPCIITAININNNSMCKLSMINCFWGKIITSLGFTPPIRSL